MTDKKCVFCDNYEMWRKNGVLINQGTDTYAIWCVTPSVPGHAIVIPKKHAVSFVDLEETTRDLDFAKKYPSMLETYMETIPQTFEAIQESIKRDPERLANFYESLRDNPPFPAAKEYAELMLKHPALRQVPEGYNVGFNFGKSAGQTMEHLHAHIFPRVSGEKSEGIVTAMRNFLSGEVELGF